MTCRTDAFVLNWRVDLTDFGIEKEWPLCGTNMLTTTVNWRPKLGRLTLFFSTMPGIGCKTPREVHHQDESIQLKFTRHSEEKRTKVKVVIATDAILILKVKKTKKSILIRPPIRTDRITPVMQEGKGNGSKIIFFSLILIPNRSLRDSINLIWTPALSAGLCEDHWL